MRWRSSILLGPAWVALMAALPARVRGSAVGAREGNPVSALVRCEGIAVEGWCLPTPRCPANTLELDGDCVPRASTAEAGSLSPETNAHTDRSGRRVVYEHLPRARDLPADYDRYAYPVAPQGHGPQVASGYDLDRPDALQRRGSGLSAVGHGGVDLLRPRGEPVRVVGLRGEAGEAEVVYVGTLFGNTVVLRHVVRAGARARTFLSLHGHLDQAAPGITRGVVVAPGTLLGFVGDTGAEGLVHLHYEVRLVREGVDPLRVEPAALTQQSVSVPCDPRNVLPFR